MGCRLAAAPASRIASSRYSPGLRPVSTTARAEPEDKESLLGKLDNSSTDRADVEQDFWEGDKFEWLGKFAFFFVPVVLVGGILVASFAASTYNEGAVSYLVTPTESRDALIVSKDDPRIGM